MEVRPAAERFAEHVRDWSVAVDHTLQTATSVLAFGTSRGRPVVLKVVRRVDEEWHSGRVLEAFGGRGVVRVYKHVPGAMLLERLSPGTLLAPMALDGRDDEATEILAGVISRMSPARDGLDAFPTVQDWGRGFAAPSAPSSSIRSPCSSVPSR
jgi:streptomycin 6-kinase